MIIDNQNLRALVRDMTVLNKGLIEALIPFAKLAEPIKFEALDRELANEYMVSDLVIFEAQALIEACTGPKPANDRTPEPSIII